MKPDGLNFVFIRTKPDGSSKSFSSAMLTQILVNGLVLSGSYALVAVGLTLTFGVMRMVNFADKRTRSLQKELPFTKPKNVFQHHSINHSWQRK